MTRINFGKVLLGGLIAGIVMNIGDYLLHQPILGEQWKAAMDAYGMKEPGSSAIVWFMIMDFIAGIAMIWLYAAIRPRFGAGARTAIVTGLTVWFFAWLWNLGGLLVMDIYPSKLIMISIFWGLVQMPLAALAGASIYKET